MEEEIKTEVSTEVVPPTPEVEAEVDYDKELKEAQEKAEANKLGYAARKAKQSVESEVIEDISGETIADQVIRRILPVINQATQSNLIDAKLKDLSGGNEALERSIKWHMENTVNPSLDINERAEAAYAIANKKVIAKTLSEINIAQKNRANIIGVGEGASTEVKQKPGDNTLSESQLSKLQQIARANSWDAKTTEKFIESTRQRLAKSK